MAGVEPKAQSPIKPKRARKQATSGKARESETNRQIRQVADRLGNVELWRNNRGVAQYDNYTVRYGVGPNGAADWIGYRKIRITPDMAGQWIAQFVAIEAKRPGETPKEDQRRFLERVNADGACSGYATSGDEAAAILCSE